LSSVDATATPEADADGAEAPETDEAREALLARWRDELGDGVVGSHIRPGDALWVRVERGAWRQAAEFARRGLGMAFFDFLSAIDWLPSPFGRDMDSQEDLVVHGAEPKELPPMETGYAGGDTRFQVLARVYDPSTARGVILKADLPDDDLSIDTWTPVYAGADWHERETWEMYGIDFVGHPNLIHIYLPSDFEGFPLRKDFPLLARRVKPWPGIVDVEPMPGGDDAAGGDESGGDAA
jgi:NADH-quinone oxidoreductase subunit C